MTPELCLNANQPHRRWKSTDRNKDSLVPLLSLLLLWNLRKISHLHCPLPRFRNGSTEKLFRSIISKVLCSTLILSFFPSRGFRFKEHIMRTKTVTVLFYGDAEAPSDQPNPEQDSQQTGQVPVPRAVPGHSCASPAVVTSIFFQV